MEDQSEISHIIGPLANIKRFFNSGCDEEITIAKNWLIQLIGQKDADANLFVMYFHLDWESDEDILIDELNYIKMKFKTFPISFGKNYMYQVYFKVVFKGEMLSQYDCEYSRHRTGEGWPKYDLCNNVCKKLKDKGYKFYNELFL